MGDPAGIGGELTLRAWLAHNSARPFVVLDDIDRLAALATRIGLEVPLHAVNSPAEALAVFGRALPVLPVKLSAPVTSGRPDTAHAPTVLASIERAVRLTQSGETAAVVTNPISKATLYGAGFTYPGHTEFIAALTGTAEPVMMLASPALRVVPVTVHLSLRSALDTLTSQGIVTAARITAEALRRDFGILRPRLGIAGLNPHAGEEGAMGDEEITTILPAIEALRSDGLDVSGPWPPDNMFTAEALTEYDVAIGMYHDQVLIPLKTPDMKHGVNVTLGLPIIRTSPDHGTAFAIAGSGKADPSSLIAALDLAATLAARREGAT
jgi:4-hydroxythreonine-4-phosphate dehydrogenase